MSSVAYNIIVLVLLCLLVTGAGVYMTIYEQPGEIDRVDSRADFYALGCVAYELLCGQPPHVADDPFDLIARHRAGDLAYGTKRQNKIPGGAALRFEVELLAVEE